MSNAMCYVFFQLRSVWLKDGAEEDCIVSINNEVILWVAYDRFIVTQSDLGSFKSAQSS